MAHINRTALLMYSDQKMFNLVNDVTAYPLYMDGCVNATVHEHTDTAMLATLDLARRGIKMSFTTHNVLDGPKSIVMSLQNGPFEKLEGRWFFQSLNDDACKVILDLQFTLSNKVTGIAAKKLFESVSNNMVDSVVLRAKQVYG